MKTCTGCAESLPRTAFYTHPATKDKLRPKCKPCTNAAATEYRKNNMDVYRNVKASLIGTPAFEARKVVTAEIRARRIVNPGVCSACDAEVKVAAHHDDYAKPLVVRWLCYPCHAGWHTANGPGANK